MRAVIQRVTRASVTVVEADSEDIAGQIDVGLLALIGVTHSDGPAEAVNLARKIFGLRILRGERSLADSPDAAVLAVSQFTVYGDARKGRRPTWQAAAPSAMAQPLFDAVVAALRDLGARVQTGRFGADMRVELINDGPITVIVDV